MKSCSSIILVKITLILIVFFNVSICDLAAQNENIGLLKYDYETTDAYLLFTPLKSNSVFLINNCGEKINEWVFSERPGATCYLLEDGTLLRAGKDSLEIRDWENQLLWSYATSLNGLNQHHDIEPLPNGNILCVIGVSYDPDDMIAQGKNPETIGESFRMDKIVELQPIGVGDAEVVWEWNYLDHLIQDFDTDKPNYGTVSEHPELLNFNYPNGNITDFTHVNAIDYNANLDQIMISSRHLNEIFIIDHSTTTEEAAGHSGGNAGLGGDFLWRWGNPAGYNQGSASDQKLVRQHDCKWVANGYLDEGKISVFSNGSSDSLFSSIHLIEPVIEEGVYKKQESVFLPLDFDWSWQGMLLNDTVFELSRSGVQCLANGNMLLCETSKGRVSEVSKSKSHLWTYVNPVGSVIYNQYDIIEDGDNAIFRAEKYAWDHPAFEGKDMSPKGILEDFNQNSTACAEVQQIEKIPEESLVLNNPLLNGVLVFSREMSGASISVFDIKANLVFESNQINGDRINLELAPAVYFVRIIIEGKSWTSKIVVLKM